VESCTGRLHAFMGWVRAPQTFEDGWGAAWAERGTGQERDKKFFVRVTEYRLNACESEMRKNSVLQSLGYKSVATFSSGNETASSFSI